MLPKLVLALLNRLSSVVFERPGLKFRLLEGERRGCMAGLAPCLFWHLLADVSFLSENPGDWPDWAELTSGSFD